MKNKLTYLFLMILSSLMVNAQTWTIGSGTTSNGNQAYPAPYGAYYEGTRHQFIYRASELAAAGVSAGLIDRFGFNVTAVNASGIHTGFNISMKNSTTDNLIDWETGLTQVLNPVDYQPVAGWILHNLDTPFNWDGTSNIIVEVCFNNTSYTENASTQWTTGLPTGTARTYREDAAGVCANTNVTTTVSSTTRPNARFVRNLTKNIEAVSVFLGGSGCYTANQDVWVRIKNVGIVDIDFSVDNMSIDISVGTTNPTAFSTLNISTGSIAVDDFLDLMITNSYDMTVAGVYDFSGNFTMSADQEADNNTFPNLSVTNAATINTPYTQDFNAGTTLPTGWAGTMSVLANHGTSGSNGLTFNLWSSAVSATSTSPKIGPIQSGQNLTLDYRLVNWTGYPGTATSIVAGDSVNIQISTNCGISYQTVYSINNTTHSTSTVFSTINISLASYVGQPIIIRFILKRATGDYYVDIDNINILTPPEKDIKALSIQAPIGCFGPNQTVAVRITNTGTDAIDFSVDNVAINVEVATTNATTFNPVVLNSGNIASGATQTIVVSNNYDMTDVGTYTFTGNIVMASDGNNANDNFPSVSINGNYTAPIATPYTQDFNSGTSMAAINWTGTMSILANHGTSSTNGLTFNLWSSTPSGQGTSPKIGAIQAGNKLTFDYRLVNFTGYPNTATSIAAGDSVNIQISTNCGATFTTVYSINSSNHTVSTQFETISINLSSYVGKNIAVRFNLRRAAGDYYVDIDNINIATPVVNKDLVALNFVHPNSDECNPSQHAMVSIQNIGTDTIYFTSSNELIVNTSVSGPNATTFTPVSITSGFIGPDSVMMVEITSNYNMSQSGDYEFSGSFTLTEDTDNTNNSFQNLAIVITAPNGGEISLSANSYCLGGTASAEVNGQIGYIIWEVSLDGANYMSIAEDITTVTGEIENLGTHYIRVQTSLGECVAYSDIITFESIESPEVFAGDNLALCDTVLVHLFSEATASTSNVNWISSGSGSFNNSTALNPMYSFSAADLVAGSVDFILIVDNGTCTNADTMTIIFDNCNSIAKTKTLNSNVSVYPNPTNGMVNIKLANESKAFVNISNSVGQIVKSEVINNSTLVDLSNFENGVYTISVIENNQVSIHKINLMK
jgi:hypothetical protein